MLLHLSATVTNQEMRLIILWRRTGKYIGSTTCVKAAVLGCELIGLCFYFSEKTQWRFPVILNVVKDELKESDGCWFIGVELTLQMSVVPHQKKIKNQTRRKIKEKIVFLDRKFGNSAVGEFRSKRWPCEWRSNSRLRHVRCRTGNINIVLVRVLRHIFAACLVRKTLETLPDIADYLSE